MTNYNQYGKVAISVAKEKGNPEENWKAEVKNAFPDSESSQKKSCPKSAFLGLCEEGLIKDIKAGSYFKRTKPNKNKKYAIEAINILKDNSTISKKELWNQVRVKLDLGNKEHNSQMDVVLALWNEGLIEK